MDPWNTSAYACANWDPKKERKKERNVTLNKSYKNVYADNYSL